MTKQPFVVTMLGIVTIWFFDRHCNMPNLSQFFMKHFCFLLIYIATSLTQLQAQGVRGKIINIDGEPLSFSTIYVRSIESGTASNIEGYYEIRLQPGKYDIVYQYMGYETVIKVIDVGEDFLEQNITLKSQTIMLKDVTIRAEKKDPAYTIMRKAIAKSKFHANQLDDYSVTVYIKGSGRLKDSPFMLRKIIEKEGIDSTMAFVTESVTEVKYTRPNKYEQNVISIRTSGDDNNTNPMEYINGTFYDPKVADAISPLSPRAFSYYKFKYDGSFVDRGYTISKIKVIPRIKGDNVFSGDLFIIEDYWSIYSLDFMVTIFGIDIELQQVCEPIENKVWLPITHKFYVDGSFLGFDFEYNYMATMSNYDITLNPDLDFEIEVIDEKVEEELAAEISRELKKSKNAVAIEKLTKGGEITRKDLRKIMREYEKQEWLEGFDESNIIGERVMKFDSSAYTQDSVYWSKIRPVPLTEYEKKGYHVIDSIAQVERSEKEGDTLKTTKRGGFKIYDPLLGNTYKIGDKMHFTFKSLLESINYNTVEGYNFDYTFELTKTFNNKTWIKLSPLGRYSFTRQLFSGKIALEYKFGNIIEKRRITIVASGGKYISQINRYNNMSFSSDLSTNNNMPLLLNTFATLMLESNYMKIYEKDFFEVRASKKLNDKINMSVKASWEDRISLSNNTKHTWINWKSRSFTRNNPEHITGINTSFTRHHATLIDVNLVLRPWLKYRIYNGKKKSVQNSSPTITTRLISSVKLFDNDVQYTLLSSGIKHRFDVGIRGVVNYNVNAGIFLRKDSLSFIDYAHFQGNRSPFTKADPVKSYRLLDYYRYSSNNFYLSGLFNYQFRRFLVTQIPWVTKKGIKENAFVNYLGTESLDSYFEIGYGWNHIYRIFKIEGVASFENGKYRDWGIRIGVAAGLDDIMNFN